MKKPLVLGIAGSNRSKADIKKLIEIITSAESYSEMKKEVNKLAKLKKVSNTDCILTSALFGAYKYGAEIEILKLRDILPPYEPFDINDIKNKEELNDIFEEADGICISTPVYFGDKSSYINSFLNIIKNTYGDLALDGKVVGVISCGAKRNGGQETTNIYTIYDCLQMGAIVVSNGSPTSQYGGTAWAGDAGVASEDDFGMATSFGTGRNIARVLRLLHYGDDKIKLRIGVIITSDTRNNTLKKYLYSILDSFIINNNYKFKFIDLTKYKLNRCKACTKCPIHDDNCKSDLNTIRQYGCLINDDLMEIHNEIINCDALLITGCSLPSNENVINVYQVFVERLRFVRRDNYQLVYTPFMTISLEHYLARSIFHLRAITSFIRHNMIVIGPPITSIIFKNNILNDEFSYDKISRFLNISSKIVSSKVKFNITGDDYIAIGYGDFEGKVSDDLFKTRVSNGNWFK